MTAGMNIVNKWLDVAAAQRKREAKAIEEKYGATVAAPIWAEVKMIDEVQNLFRTMQTTPIEDWIEQQKKKAPK